MLGNEGNKTTMSNFLIVTSITENFLSKEKRVILIKHLWLNSYGHFSLKAVKRNDS